MNQEYQVLGGVRFVGDTNEQICQVRKLKPYGLKFNELNIIRFIAQRQMKSSLSKNDLSRIFNLPHSTVVGIVFRLEDKGWLLMGNSHFDKRHTTYCYYG